MLFRSKWKTDGDPGLESAMDFMLILLIVESDWVCVIRMLGDVVEDLSCVLGAFVKAERACLYSESSSSRSPLGNR